MAEALLEAAPVVETPDVSRIITEDDTPVDNVFSAKQQRLLVEPLYSSWKPGRLFFADANVGIFRSVHEPPIVPDMFLSLDVQPAEDIWAKRHRTYFVWEFGKPPEIVVEVVSNTEGGETTDKVGKYARLGVKYYVIFDPQQLLLAKMLQIYELSGGRYVLKRDQQLAQVGLGVVLWDGVFEGMYERWLRWCDPEGRLILSGIERAEQAEAKVNRERQYARQERQRAERLAARLRAMGIEPDDEG